MHSTYTISTIWTKHLYQKRYLNSLIYRPLLLKICLADLVIFEAFTTLSQNHPDIYKKYPKVVAFREKVAKNAEIKKFIDSKQGTTPM